MQTSERVSRFVRPEVARMAHYEPVEPVEVVAARHGIAPERVIKLDGNENLYGPAPAAVRAIAEHRGYNIYPDPDQAAVRACQLSGQAEAVPSASQRLRSTDRSSGEP